MPQQNTSYPAAQPVIVKKTVVKQRRSMSLVETLGWIIVTLAILLVLVLASSFGVWMYTFKALTQEKVIAELYVSKKTYKDGVPTFTVRYVPKNEDTAIPFWGNSLDNSANNEYRADMQGDQVFVDSNFIRWENWSTLVGFKPVYKTYRVKSDFQDLIDRDKYKSSAFEMNGGQDGFIKEFSANKDTWGWLVQSAFLSSAGTNVTDKDQKYDVIVTKDALVLEQK